jgi:hemerythrin-like domain-containing protein
MKESVLEIIYKTHTRGTEKALFTIDFVRKFNDENIFSKLADILQFFYKHIPIHFKYEEIVIGVLTSKYELSEKEKQLIENILSEHNLMTKNFQAIKELTAKKEGSGDGAQEQLVELVNDTLDMLIKHAEMEDTLLYPLADAKLRDEHLELIKKEISNISF